MNRHWKSSVLVALLAWFVMSSELPALERQVIADRLKQLQSMTKLDRERLDRNIQEYQGMTADQKMKYWELHEQLVVDRKDAGALSSTLQTYVLWVQTLSPAQRDELHRETDPAKKIVLARQFKEEQDRPVESTEPQHDEPTPQSNSTFPLKFAKLVMDAKELVAVMNVLVEALPFDGKKAEFEHVQFNQYLRLIEVSAQSSGKLQEWPDETLLAKMAGKLSKEKQKNIVGSASKRETIIRMMLIGVWKLAFESVRYPTEEERLQTGLALPLEERERVLKLPTEALKQYLTRKWFESKGDESYKEPPKYRREVLKMFERLEVTPPPNFAPRQQAKKPLKPKG